MQVTISTYMNTAPVNVLAPVSDCGQYPQTVIFSQPFYKLTAHKNTHTMNGHVRKRPENIALGCGGVKRWEMHVNAGRSSTVVVLRKTEVSKQGWEGSWQRETELTNKTVNSTISLNNHMDLANFKPTSVYCFQVLHLLKSQFHSSQLCALKRKVKVWNCFH